MDLTCLITLNDILPDKHSDLAICVIPANREAAAQLEVTRENIILYANRCGADYIELTGDKAPEWPMSNKYRLKQVIEKYERTLYLDCDVVVKPDAPNIFQNSALDKVCFVDEWKIIKDSYENLFSGLQIERSKVILRYPSLARNNRAIQPNGGVMLFPRDLAHRYSQPPGPYPKFWCFDQDYLLLNLEDDEFEIIDWRYNLEFIDTDFWNKIEESYFVHLNGSKPISYRIELLKRIVSKDYSPFIPPPPDGAGSAVDKFRPNWREKDADK